jgi:hypothetical protein
MALGRFGENGKFRNGAAMDRPWTSPLVRKWRSQGAPFSAAWSR